MNKKDFNTNFKYFFKALLIAFIPLMVIMYFVQMYVKSDVLNWVITFIMVALTLLIAFWYQTKKQNLEEENKKDKKFDPYSD